MKEMENKSELCKLVGANLKEIRTKKNLSQEMLANEASLNVSHYRNIEHGCGNPCLHTLERLSGTLNITLQEILMQGALHCESDYFSFQQFGLSEEDSIFFNNLFQQMVDLLTNQEAE